jgi:hypothetical protein
MLKEAVMIYFRQYSGICLESLTNEVKTSVRKTGSRPIPPYLVHQILNVPNWQWQVIDSGGVASEIQKIYLRFRIWLQQIDKVTVQDGVAEEL